MSLTTAKALASTKMDEPSNQDIQSTENEAPSIQHDSYTDTMTDSPQQDSTIGAPYPKTELEAIVDELKAVQKEKDELVYMLREHEKVAHAMRIQNNELQVSKAQAIDQLKVELEQAQFASSCQMMKERADFKYEASEQLAETEAKVREERLKYSLLQKKVHDLIKRNVTNAEALTEERDEAREHVQTLNEGKERLRQEVIAERKKVGQETARIGKLKQELTFKTSELKKSHEVAASLQEQLDLARKEKGQAESQLSQAAMDRSDAHSRLEERCKNLEGGNAKLQARLDGSLRKSADLQDSLTTAKRDATAAKEKLNDRLSEATLTNSQLQEKLSTAMNDVATAKGESSATVEELNARLKEASHKNDKLEQELNAIKEAASEAEAAEKLVSRIKRSEKRQSGNIKKRAGKMLAEAGTQEVSDDLVTHLQDQLAEALKEANTYKIANKRLETQIQESNHKGSGADSKRGDTLRAQKSDIGRLRSASDPHGIPNTETKNERIAELEAKNTELEAAAADGPLYVYPFELRKIQSLKAELQKTTDERDHLVEMLQKTEHKNEEAVSRSAQIKHLKKEVSSLSKKIYTAADHISELSGDLTAIEAKLSAL